MSTLIDLDSSSFPSHTTNDGGVVRKHLELVKCWCCMWSEACCRSPQAHSFTTSHPWSIGEAVSRPCSQLPIHPSPPTAFLTEQMAEWCWRRWRSRKTWLSWTLPAVIQHLQQVHDLIIHPDVRPIGNRSAHYWIQEMLSWLTLHPSRISTGSQQGDNRQKLERAKHYKDLLLLNTLLLERTAGVVWVWEGGGVKRLRRQAGRRLRW